jgi:hypothetical protein
VPPRPHIPQSRNAYRGLVQVQPGASGARNFSQCDSMLIGDTAGANTYPYIQVGAAGLARRGPGCPNSAARAAPDQPQRRAPRAAGRASACPCPTPVGPGPRAPSPRALLKTPPPFLPPHLCGPSQVREPSAVVEHEASTSKIGEDQLFYFQQRGVDVEDAVGVIISGFCREVFNELPLEFAAEVRAGVAAGWGARGAAA